jgi:hypothetical protein
MGSGEAKTESTRIRLKQIKRTINKGGNRMEFKQRILAEQEKRKLSNKQMAELLGVDNATYWRYKKGLTNNLRDTQKIIQKLEIKFA